MAWFCDHGMIDSINELTPTGIFVVMVLWFVWKIVEVMQTKRNDREKSTQSFSCAMDDRLDQVSRHVRDIHEVTESRGSDGERLVFRQVGLEKSIEKLAENVGNNTDAIREQTRWMEGFGTKQDDLKRAIDRIGT